MSIVRDLEKVYSFGVAMHYDTNFRSERLSSNLAWGQLDQDLWMKSVTLVAKAEAEAKAAKAEAQAKNGNKVCFQFKKQSGCYDQQCEYPHVCKMCRKPHPEYRCFQKHKPTHTQHTAASNGKASSGQNPLLRVQNANAFRSNTH